MKWVRYISLGLIFWGLISFQGIKVDPPYVFPKMTWFPNMPIAKDNPVGIHGVELGRHLFYDPILSRDSMLSCSSCHQQKAAFSDPGSRFSVGVEGIELDRNTMPLFNLAWYEAYFWDGRASSLEEQALHPVRAHLEMNLSWEEAIERLNRHSLYPLMFEQAFGSRDIDSFLVGKALAQFERSLLSYNSKYDQVLRGEAYLTDDEYEGFVLMNEQNKGACLHCHNTDAHVLATSGGFANNGLDMVSHPEEYPDWGLGKTSGKEEDIGRFRIPSLRNIALTAPYMHDGRFKSLEEVLRFYSQEVNQTINLDSKMFMAHPRGVQLSDRQQQQIIAFLHTLTDSVFIHNPAHSSPFN
ncbi:MAG: cytochrome c peroxidase [Bacteroidota bacterium]